MELRTKVLSGLKWVAGAKLIGQIINWTVTLVVVRLLTPADYGLMALATMILSFLTLLAELGLGAAIIQKNDLTKQQLRQSFGIILLLNFSLCALLNLYASNIADFFGESELESIIHLMSVGFVISAFIIMPEALLEKDLKYKNKSLVLLFASLIQAIITLTLALLDYGIWALVWGHIAMVTIYASGLNIIYPPRYLPVISFRNMKEIISFSSMVAAERSILMIYSQADTFIIGKIFGKEPLGIYSVSMNLASLPMQKISGLINQVAFPAFASIQAEKEKIRQYVLKVIRTISFVTFPVFWGISCVSPELVITVLSDKWEAAIIPLQLLTLIMPIRMIGNMSSPILRGIGRADIAVVNLIVSAIIMTFSFLIGTNWGILGVCYAWLIAYPVVFTIIMFRASKIYQTKLTEIVLSMLRPAIAAAGMYLSVMIVRNILPDSMEMIFKLAVLVAVGVVGYIIFVALFAREHGMEVRDLIKR